MIDIKAVRDFIKRILLSFWLFIGVLLAGTAGFRIISGGKASFIDCLYMTVITVATVGYGEIVDLSHSPAGRVFAMVLIFAGMGIILYFISNVTAFLIDGNLREIIRRSKMEKLVESMSGHYIICGAGTMGMHVVEEVHGTRHKCVVIDTDAARLSTLETRCPGLGTIEGDASENDVLMAAGLARAAGIVICTGSDKDNLVVTITARQISGTVRIVARCNDIKHSEKLKLAGADSVVSGNYISGLRMASEMLRPAVVSFLDVMLRDRERALRIEEFRIPQGSRLDGAPASTAKSLALTLALVSPDGQYTFNPQDTLTLKADHTIVYMGTPEDRDKLQSAC